MNNQALREKVAEMFNRGAYELYLPSVSKPLYTDGGDFTIGTIVLNKAKGKTNQEKYNDIRKRCVVLYRRILYERLTGFYFTPYTLLYKWEPLGSIADLPEISLNEWRMREADFMSQPWVVNLLMERDQREIDERKPINELVRCLRRFREVVV